MGAAEQHDRAPSRLEEQRLIVREGIGVLALSIKKERAAADEKE